MKRENEERLYTTLDAYRAGFLKIRGHEPSLIEQDDKFVFAFPLTANLKKDIDDYENGALVDAMKFAMSIKSVKTRIHSLRKELL